MKKTNRPKSWTDPHVTSYEHTIPRKIPGYSVLYELTADLMKISLPQERNRLRLLIVGAGGGQELVTLGNVDKNWLFTAVDSSKPMLELARQRSSTFRERIRFVETEWEQFSEDVSYDGATCLLVLHFIKGFENKRKFLTHISDCLVPGAPFFLAGIQGDTTRLAFSVQMEAWKRYMLRQGITSEAFDEFAVSIGSETDPLTDDQTIALLHECGFTEVSSYFGSFLISGYHCFKQ